MQDQSTERSEKQIEPAAVVGEGLSEHGLLVSLTAAGQVLLSDEPIEQGGTGRGPDPYDYLSVALASCTIMTLHMYARHKKWPLEAVRAEIRHSKIHAEDCENCETRTGKIDRFERLLRLKGDLSDEQRQRLLQIADRCPVHRTLHEEVDIRTTLAD